MILRFAWGKRCHRFSSGLRSSMMFPVSPSKLFHDRPSSDMPNHLIAETSPYLLQHVDNPVDWHPWGDEALGLARELDRPIFLSIGYSACHWCHVMEHESFENVGIAALLNQWFICIKVDREERPDLDQIYMTAVQAMIGSGGWPMSVFLTPALKPFYGGTYWPPTARGGQPGFREVLAGVHDAWVNRRAAVDNQADELTNHVVQLSSPTSPRSPLTEGTLRRVMQSLIQTADPVHGGFGSAPKFPHSMAIRLGMRCWKRFGGGAGAASRADQSAPGTAATQSPVTSPELQVAEQVLNLVTLTLDKMARGGIYDHLGGGFARYSTDERWLVPHFEKMLYDNAQLVPAYLEAYQITGRPDFARVARETLDYVQREMTQPSGGFYSTQDADSEGVEGKFFVWSAAEVDAVLNDSVAPGDRGLAPAASLAVEAARDASSILKYCYDISPQGNWEHSNILHRPHSDQQDADTLGLNPDDLVAILARGRQKLFNIRSQRVWPGRDDKVLTSWNGLMIGAMALGANVLGEPRYADAARAAADFILAEMVEPAVAGDATCRLLHSYQDGRARFNGYLDDYAAMIDGLCELYQTVFDVRYLTAALGLAERMLAQFWDSAGTGFFYTSADHETLIARNKETFDNATPSGNSLAAIGLLKLARLTGRADLEIKAVATLEMMSGQLEQMPLAAGLSLMALDFLLGPTHEIVIAEGPATDVEREVELPTSHSAVSRRLIARLHQRFVPNKVIHWRAAGESDGQLSEATRTVLNGKVALRQQTTAYVCEHGKCGLPIVGDRAVSDLLERL
jgi:uncharacterized protein YyaL (SSP411 family)